MAKEILQIQTKFNDIYEYYRDENGIKKCNKVEFNNFLYIKEEDYKVVIDLIRGMERNYKYKYEDPKIEHGKVSMFDEKIIKITPNKFEWWKIKKILKENKIKTFEADLDVYLKYILKEKSIFSKNRKIGLIDIENDFSLDVINAPKPITAITVYNYQDNKYYTWVWSDILTPNNRIKTNEILYFFKEEKQMLEHFINKHREFDFDISGSWNGDSFDWPYLITRMKNLGLNINNLSSFGEVGFRHFEIKGRKYFDIEIPGLEVLDFIPVLKKCCCYSAMPASFSLESACNWYLKDCKKLKEIGPQAWKTDIDLFITYNINDVYLVKRLIDDYKLIDFLYIIQCETVPVPLKHTYHNSVVLVYFLKQTFPNIVIPDCTSTYIIENDFIDFNYNWLKLKAATVLPTPIGVFDNMLIFDFSALYTTIFRSLGISPEQIVKEKTNNAIQIDDIIVWKMAGDDLLSTVLKEYNLKINFRQDRVGIYPTLLKILWERRNYYKSKMNEIKKKEGTSSLEYHTWQYRSDVMKNILNSLYGVGSFSKFPLYNIETSAAVTSVSRKLIDFASKYCESKGMKVCGADTDSLFLQNIPNYDEKQLEKELNEKLKEFIFKTFPEINKNNYCLFFEFQKKLKRMAFKGVKKKYFGVDYDGNIHVKGFSIIRHDLPFKLKIHLEKLFLMLINREKILVIKDYLIFLKKEIERMPLKEIGIELRLSQNPDEYKVNQEISRAAKYSNLNLGTDFKAGDVGKLIYIKSVSGLPKTDVVLLNDDIDLDSKFEVDYNKMFEKLVSDSLVLLEDIKEFRIQELLSENKSILEYC